MPRTKERQPALIPLGDASQTTIPATNRKGNDLDGATWTRYSISVWNDIRKSASEVKAKHPAMFPTALATRLIDCFTTRDDKFILDPFMGSGSTLVAADHAGKTGIGFDISSDYIELTEQRLKQNPLFRERTQHHIIDADARQLDQYLKPNSISCCITSPLIGIFSTRDEARMARSNGITATPPTISATFLTMKHSLLN